MSATRPDDTIAAVATAAGRGALAIVRMSGAGAAAIGARCIAPWPSAARQATLGRVLGAEGETLDEGIAVYYRAPASFTGEDVVEFTCHGGPVVAATILATFVAHGARPAEPGEFTRRAVLNGRLDLLQAEAIGDLVDATSRAAQRVALSQLDGGLSRRIAGLRDAILGLEALAAYDIDFPEEDDGPVPPARIVAAARGTIQEIDVLLATAPMGELVRDGAVVVIAGAPNAGKSSLFNALLGKRRAIVTEIPGTTRDALEAVTETGGWPIRLVDTAGLRETRETVERLGIEVSQEYLERADVVLVCGDSGASLRDSMERVRRLTDAPRIVLRTKADLADGGAGDPGPRDVIAVSAETGTGLAAVTAAIAATLDQSRGALRFDAPLVTRERHRVALSLARDELERFLNAFAADQLPAVVAAVHLREATRHLEELIGTVDIEDLLDRLFRNFCVGK